ncbi:hypothetical protein A7X12_16620 [Sphingomonas sp. TDK1]|nr:hypothetical protein A7X12_16620 [Sphingomonas sp. TDK1]
MLHRDFRALTFFGMNRAMIDMIVDKRLLGAGDDLVMMSAIGKHLEDGQDEEQAIADGAMERVRPVLMTAMVASLGLLPMALATGTGAAVQRPLAIVVIGGLITSTVLTLLVLPAITAWVSRLRPRRRTDTALSSA